ncbi:MAG: GTP-binding protein [Bacteroidota bacterium]
MDVLKITTAGSVDDGKSTLIGRLLWDSGSLRQDQIATIERTSRDRGKAFTDLSLVTDGLRAERDQGITIDVAHIYFDTPKRKFIIADSPGHVEYTRNMVTGASNARVAIILIDARKGVLEQTHRHFAIAALLRIPEVIVVINKMDLVGYEQSAFTAIRGDFRQLTTRLRGSAPRLHFIPVSATAGDNVVAHSKAMPWYGGPTLLEFLEELPVPDEAAQPGRFPVQWVIRPQSAAHPDYRGYAGRIAAGSLSVGEPVVVLPSGRRSTVTRIQTLTEELETAPAGRSVTVHLADQVDVSRGDMLVPSAQVPTATRNLRADICWMDHRNLNSGRILLLQHGTRRIKAKVTDLDYKLNVHTLDQVSADGEFKLNDIGGVRLRLGAALHPDRYADSRATGAFILIDPHLNQTVAAGMITGWEAQ